MARAVHEALGFVETRGLVAALEAADAMLKSSQVSLIGVERTDAALITVQVSGDTAAVQSAVEAGVAAAKRIGLVVSSHVIARPSSDVFAMQMAKEKPISAKSSVLEDMTVRDLRAFARTVENLSIQGREIARANKQQLLKALKNRS